MTRTRSLLIATLSLSAALSAALLPCRAAAQPQAAHTQAATTDKPLPSPPAQAQVTMAGKAVVIDYNTPMMRGRKIMGGLVPYDKVWRTGANPATSLKTQTDLRIGSAQVPAGSYTLYTLPSAGTWMLIINKQTGQWGTQYDQAQDLARVPMNKASLPQPQEKMSITFENTHGDSTELHVRWETTDVSVPVRAQ
ncbi:MAG TPA: DUF2911 domain-containing protein [Acidobacteriaceae bacterium]